jgi:pimeloyl-ACP methyl ester carboxylesterase
VRCLPVLLRLLAASRRCSELPASFPELTATHQPSSLADLRGGPGGSGHAYTFRAAPALSHVLEDRYDILGFDPRGINQTLPRMACFEKLRTERDFLKSLSPSLDSLDVGTEAYAAGVREKDLENQLIAERCELEAGAAGRNVRI